MDFPGKQLTAGDVNTAPAPAASMFFASPPFLNLGSCSRPAATEQDLLLSALARERTATGAGCRMEGTELPPPLQPIAVDLSLYSFPAAESAPAGEDSQQTVEDYGEHGYDDRGRERENDDRYMHSFEQERGSGPERGAEREFSREYPHEYTREQAAPFSPGLVRGSKAEAWAGRAQPQPQQPPPHRDWPRDLPIAAEFVDSDSHDTGDEAPLACESTLQPLSDSFAAPGSRDEQYSNQHVPSRDDAQSNADTPFYVDTEDGDQIPGVDTSVLSGPGPWQHPPLQRISSPSSDPSPPRMRPALDEDKNAGTPPQQQQQQHTHDRRHADEDRPITPGPASFEELLERALLEEQAQAQQPQHDIRQSDQRERSAPPQLDVERTRAEAGDQQPAHVAAADRGAELEVRISTRILG